MDDVATFVDLSEPFSHTQGVADSANWRQLGDFLRQRRAELGLGQDDVRAAGGPSAATQRKLENGELGSYRTGTWTDLDRALRLPAGTTWAILNGTARPQDHLDAHKPTGNLGPDTIAAVQAIADDETASPHLRVMARTTLEQIAALIDANRADRDRHRRTG